jgi:hypothetical protein
MKNLFLLALLNFCSFSLFAQVQSGNAIDSGRKVLGTPNYVIQGKTSGIVIIEVAIDNKGVVTSAKVVEGTTIKSTPTVMIAQNAAKKLKFTAGTHYPEFQQARIKYTYVKTVESTPPAPKVN